MQKWSLIDVDDALELLSKQFTNTAVRKYAVSRLREADDEVGLIFNSHFFIWIPGLNSVQHQIGLKFCILDRFRVADIQQRS